MTESQHNALYARAQNLFYKADLYENGILNSNSQTTLGNKILPQKSIENMVESVNAKLLPAKKVAVSKRLEKN